MPSCTLHLSGLRNKLLEVKQFFFSPSTLWSVECLWTILKAFRILNTPPAFLCDLTSYSIKLQNVFFLWSLILFISIFNFHPLGEGEAERRTELVIVGQSQSTVHFRTSVTQSLKEARVAQQHWHMTQFLLSKIYVYIFWGNYMRTWTKYKSPTFLNKKNNKVRTKTNERKKWK